ncbi:hypothetical protein [Nonomuraea sp. LPB2021202275-12-8]|uniref:hypothetical protein n=1 Tax=Nonomuraea sp. LPB2021202275-12-8 TaxID=3120159 RepID=UPI00300D7343
MIDKDFDGGEEVDTMSFDVRDLQGLNEREPVAAAARISHCFKHVGCSDLAGYAAA